MIILHAAIVTVQLHVPTISLRSCEAATPGCDVCLQPEPDSVPLPRMSSTYNWFPDSTNVCKGLQCISTLVGAAYITDTLLEQTRGFFYYMKTFLERATSSMSPECWIGVVQLEIYVLYSANLKILDELFSQETYLR
jgi:hypothetical protein